VTQREWTKTLSHGSVSEPRIEIRSSKLWSRQPNHYNMVNGSITANLRVCIRIVFNFSNGQNEYT
jgi:hypothetical protein